MLPERFLQRSAFLLPSLLRQVGGFSLEPPLSSEIKAKTAAQGAGDRRAGPAHGPELVLGSDLSSRPHLLAEAAAATQLPSLTGKAAPKRWQGKTLHTADPTAAEESCLTQL